MCANFDCVTVSYILVIFQSMKILPAYSIQYILNATQYMQLIMHILFGSRTIPPWTTAPRQF